MPKLRSNGRVDHQRASRVLRVAPAPAPVVEPEPAPIAPDDPAAIAIHRAIASGVVRLRASEAPARGRDPEAIHRMRTSTRRLRSVLRTFQPLLDPAWAEALEDELKWLGQLLGDVRDMDVLVDRLNTEAGKNAPALAPLFESLRLRGETSRHGLEEALDGARFGELMTRLADAAERPRLRDEAWEPCRSALPGLVREAWQRVRRRGRDLDDDDPDEDFHEVRKRAKAARYAAEAVQNALGAHCGRDAERFAKKARAVQDVLGAHQDAVVASEEVRRVRAMFRDDAPFRKAAKRLARRLDQSANESRKQFFKTWRKFDRKKLRRWLDD